METLPFAHMHTQEKAARLALLLIQAGIPYSVSYTSFSYRFECPASSETVFRGAVATILE